MKRKRAVCVSIAVTVLATVFLWLCLPIRITKTVGNRFIVGSGPRTQNPLYLAVYSGVSADKFEALVSSNSAWINQVDRTTLISNPPSLLSVCADLKLTNHVRILIQHGAKSEDAIAYEAKYEATNQIALIKYCQQALDEGKK
jgi:hypothetical protein